VTSSNSRFGDGGSIFFGNDGTYVSQRVTFRKKVISVYYFFPLSLKRIECKKDLCEGMYVNHSPFLFGQCQWEVQWPCSLGPACLPS